MIRVAMNKNESKYFNTAAKMDEAFLELLSRKDFPYITVKEICERAGVHRSTFYLHYETTADLLSECVEYIEKRFLSYVQSEKSADSFSKHIQSCSDSELYLITPAYLKPFLQFIRENRCLYKTALKNSRTLRLEKTYDKMFRFVFQPILERYRVPAKDRPHIMTFYLSGLTALIDEWVSTDCAESDEYMIHLFRRCIPTDGRNLS